MSLTTPTTQEISRNILAQLEAALNQNLSLLPKSFLRVLAKALSGVFTLLYKYSGFIFLQMFVASASANDTEVNGATVNPLRFWGRLIGVGEPTPATQAELSVEVTVTTQAGNLPSGTQLLNSNNGVTYIMLGGVILNMAKVLIEVRAVSDQSGGGGAGALGNLESGDLLSFANPVANVDSTAIVASQVVTGANAEAVEVYRQRILDRFQKRPQGGAYSDYELWGEETPGIINVYPYTGSPGQVDLYSEATVASSGSEDGTPTTAQLESVLTYINLPGRRNANAFVNSLPIIRTGFDVQIVGISGVADLAEVRANIDASLKDYFFTLGPFIPGLSIPPRRDQLTSTRISALVEDIITAASGTFTIATVKLTGTTTNILVYVMREGEKAKVVTVSYL